MPFGVHCTYDHEEEKGNCLAQHHLNLSHEIKKVWARQCGNGFLKSQSMISVAKIIFGHPSTVLPSYSLPTLRLFYSRVIFANHHGSSSLCSVQFALGKKHSARVMIGKNPPTKKKVDK